MFRVRFLASIVTRSSLCGRIKQRSRGWTVGLLNGSFCSARSEGFDDDDDDDGDKTGSEGGTDTEKKANRIAPDTKALEMLRVYKSIHDNLHVFPSYIIPAESPWPVEFHGYPLGKKVCSLRRQRYLLWDFYRYRLDTLGFIWKPNDYRIEKAIQALELYKHLFGDLNVPQHFVVPNDDIQWPKIFWGYKLGKTLHNIRCGGVFSARRQLFEEIGVNFDVKAVRVPDFFDIKQSLYIYKFKYGNFEVPTSYIIPMNDHDFPLKMRGAQLGMAMSQIIHRKYYEEHHNELIEMGVPLQPRFELRFKRIFEAFKCYKSKYNSTFVPNRFVFPYGSKDIPEQMWGMKLGRTYSSIRKRGDFKQFHYLLRELGFLSKDISSGMGTAGSESTTSDVKAHTK